MAHSVIFAQLLLSCFADFVRTICKRLHVIIGFFFNIFLDFQHFQPLFPLLFPLFGQQKVRCSFKTSHLMNQSLFCEVSVIVAPVAFPYRILRFVWDSGFLFGYIPRRELFRQISVTAVSSGFLPEKGGSDLPAPRRKASCSRRYPGCSSAPPRGRRPPAQSP